MKIGIITVFDAVNYGSYLQAYCLQLALNNMGYTDITMIKVSSILYEKWRITSLVSYHPKKIKFKFILAKGYINSWKKFNISRNKRGYDLVIIGSDEMWELNNITMKPLPNFFGLGITSKRLITYAVSSNTTKESDIENYPYIAEGLKNFDSVSVRDRSTFKAYNAYVNGKIEYAIDPTLLIDLHQLATKYIGRTDYILCYTYTFESYMVEAVKELAKKFDKKIIVVGQNFEWADECIPADALEFLGLINKADFIVTDTFHGTVLSIGLNKQFVSFAHKEKVHRILEQLGLLDRDVAGVNTIIDKYSELIDYIPINRTIAELRQNSLRYLRENCTGILEQEEMTFAK